MLRARHLYRPAGRQLATPDRLLTHAAVDTKPFDHARLWPWRWGQMKSDISTCYYLPPGPPPRPSIATPHLSVRYARRRPYKTKGIEGSNTWLVELHRRRVAWLTTLGVLDVESYRFRRPLAQFPHLPVYLIGPVARTLSHSVRLIRASIDGIGHGTICRCSRITIVSSTVPLLHSKLRSDH